MPNDQDITTPRRRSRRQQTPQEVQDAPLAVQASAESSPPTEEVARGDAAKPARRRGGRAPVGADGVGSANGASTPHEASPLIPVPAEAGGEKPPAKPSRRRGAKAAEIPPDAPETSGAAAPETFTLLTLDELPSDTGRSGRGPRVSRPRGKAKAAEAEIVALPERGDDSAPVAPATAAMPPRAGRGRRAFRRNGEPLTTITEVTKTASGVSVFRETPVSSADGDAAPAVASSNGAEPTSAPSPYRFRRRAQQPTSAPSEPEPQGAATSADAPASDASNPTPQAGGDAAAPVQGAAEPGERVTSSDVVVRPLRRSWSGQNGRDRAMPHIPGGNEPYRGREAEQGQSAQGQGQFGQPAGQGQSGQGRAPGNRPGFQRGQHQQGQPGGARGNAPYSPGAGAAGGQQSGQDQRPGAPAYERLPYGQRGDVPPYAPYGPYEQYPGYPTGPQQDRGPGLHTPERPSRGRGGYQNQPGYPGYPAQPGYSDQRGGRPPGRTGGTDYYLPNPRDRRGYPDRTDRPDRRGIGGRPLNRPGRERDGYGAPGYAPGYAPGAGEGRYTNPRPAAPQPPARTVDVGGLLWLGGGPGMSPAELLDNRTLQPIARMIVDDVRRMGLRSGDIVVGRAEERGGRRIVVALETVNDVRPEELRERPQFESLTASFPDRRIRLEHGPQPVSVRIIDLFAPLGFGSRALVVAPPKTGKTTLIREAAESVLSGYPEAVVMAVLVGERPEEVTDLRARLEPRGGFVYAASFDEDTQRHAWLVQVAVERAKRVAESGRDAFMVLDSLTRLARAENLASRGAGRTLSGGIDAQALDTGRRAFGAARNLEEGGSITILATCLVDTGSRQDDVVYEEFKGTGNMELHLSRELSQRRLFPAVDAIKSGTRREEMLLTPEELRAATALRRRLADLPVAAATEQLLKVLERTQSNAALLQAIEQSGWMAGAR